ncbi:alpha/beta fold hydrolase [bacterium CPR1]|nr:alpha/beta fold hydrolase [bacterium CPR1]
MERFVHLPRHARGVAAGLVILALLGALAWAQDDIRGTARKFSEHLRSGNFPAARAMFDPDMTRVVSQKAFMKSWKVMIEKHGPFQKFGTATVEAIPPYQAVFIPCAFGKHRCRLKVVLNAKNQVSGYFWVSFGASPPAYRQVKSIEHKVQVGKWKLPGLIALPPTRTPVRAGVVLVHGSGPNDRDETIGPNKPFLDLARGLAGQGLATLRYDKRTRTYGLAMAFKKPTLEEEVLEDALAALKLLRARPELKGRPIIVLGHSLGGILGPEIARRDGHVQGLILMAAPARPFDEVLIDQLEYLVKLHPAQKEAVDKMIRALRRFEQLSDEDKTILGAPAGYWREIAAYQKRSLETARQLSCPILILQGGRDYQSTEPDYRLWMEALKGRPAVSGQLYPALNHLFAPGKGKARPEEYEEQNYIDPEVIERIAQWCPKR